MNLFIKKLLLIVSLLGLTTIVSAADRLVLVANTDQTDLSLNREQVRNLFMGGALGYDLTPVVLSAGDPLRSLFNTHVIGLAESRIQSYWAQMKFTGRLKPPKEFSSQAKLLKYLSATPDSVGYLYPSAEIPAALTIIYRLPE